MIEQTISISRYTDFMFVNYIGSGIIKSDLFKRGISQTHHGRTTVANHSLRVAMMSTRIGLFLYRHGFRVDLDSLIKSALTHDVGIIGRDDGRFHGFKECCLFQHPKDSLKEYRTSYGSLNNIEYNAIRAHMFPFCLSIPIYRESWILTISDKIVSIIEITTDTDKKIDWSKL